jgi:actin-related protein
MVIANECFQCSQLLFKPSSNGFMLDNIDQALWSSTVKCDIHIRKHLDVSIVLSGGSMIFDGFPERLAEEITRFAPWVVKIKVIAPPQRKYGVWIGVSIVASLVTFSEKLVTREEYDASGPGLVYRLCSAISESMWIGSFMTALCYHPTDKCRNQRECV